MDEREKVCGLIEEAVMAGACKDKACGILGYDIRTIQRWDKNLEGDRRKFRADIYPGMPCQQRKGKRLSPTAAMTGLLI